MRRIYGCRKVIVVSIVTVGLGACSTAKVRIMPGENGLHRAVARDIEKEGAEGAAVDKAKDYCKDKSKEAVFVQDKSSYTGSIDEDTRKTVRNASQAAQVLGGFGSPIGTAGQAGRMMTNDRDYEAEVTFKCQ